MYINRVQSNSNPYFQGELSMINLRRGKKAVVQTSKKVDEKIHDYVRDNFVNSERKTFNNKEMTEFESILVKECGLTMPNRRGNDARPIMRDLDGKEFIFEVPQVYRIVHKI